MTNRNESIWWVGGMALGVALLTACGTVKDSDSMAVDAAPSPVPDAAPVVECDRRAESVTDVAGRRWDEVWYCRNDAGAAVYAETSAASTLTANMDTQYSWFVCYRRGDGHVGGNDVWYYTQGDRPAPGAAEYNEWGYMPGFNVRVNAHPAVGVPAC